MYRNIVSIGLRGAQVIIFLYDVTRRETLDEIPAFLQMTETNGTENVIKVLLANKVDNEYIHR